MFKGGSIIANRLLYDKEKIREHELHINRLRKVKSTVDNRAPKKPMHLKHKGKRDQLILEKYTEIQKENRILLQKMMLIDLKPTKLNPGKIKLTNTPSAFSLNRGKRIRELTRVTAENKHLLKRL